MFGVGKCWGMSERMSGGNCLDTVPELPKRYLVTLSVSVNAQTDVFTSEKSVRNVQNFRAGRK